MKGQFVSNNFQRPSSFGGKTRPWVSPIRERYKDQWAEEEKRKAPMPKAVSTDPPKLITTVSTHPENPQNKDTIKPNTQSISLPTIVATPQTQKPTTPKQPTTTTTKTKPALQQKPNVFQQLGHLPFQVGMGIGIGGTSSKNTSPPQPLPQVVKTKPASLPTIPNSTNPSTEASAYHPQTVSKPCGLQLATNPNPPRNKLQQHELLPSNQPNGFWFHRAR